MMKRLLTAVAVAAVVCGQGVTINGSRTLIGSTNVQYANAGSTGTTVNKLAKLTGAPSTAVIFATTDTTGLLGIVVAGAGTTGNAQIAVSGQASCVFDGATTAGHWVTSSTGTAGDCHDEGVATSSAPTASIPLVGVVTTTNGGGGTYTVDMSLYAAVVGGSGTPGGSNTQCQYNNSGAFGGISGCTTNGTVVTLTNPVVGTQSQNDNSTKAASTAYTDLAVANAAHTFFQSCTATAPAFSATPTFSLAAISTTSPCVFEPGTMTANVTPVTITNKTAGAIFGIMYTQDGTGGRTFAPGASITGACQPDPTAGATTTMFFHVENDGTTVKGDGCHYTTSILFAPEISMSGAVTPVSGFGVAGFDSANHIWCGKQNGSGTLACVVVPTTCTNQVVSAIPATGIPTCHSIVAGDLPTAAGSFSILNGKTFVDTTGGALFNPPSIIGTNNKFYEGTYFFGLTDNSTQPTALSCLGTSFRIPWNTAATVSAANIILTWASSKTTGAVYWSVDASVISTGSLDPASAQEAGVNTTTTTNGTAWLTNTSTIALTAGNWSGQGGNLALFNVCRDGTQTGDTLAGWAVLYDAQLQLTVVQ